MSKISDKPKLWNNKEVLFSINIYEADWILKIELDWEWNIKTNINWLIDKIIKYSKEWKIIKIEHDLYSRLNNWIFSIRWDIKDEVVEIIKKLYYSELPPLKYSGNKKEI